MGIQFCKKKRGRAKGRFLIGKRKEWRGDNSELGIELEKGLLVLKIKNRKQEVDLVIVSVYNTGE